MSEDLLSKHPALLVDMALSKLQASGIELVEWRALLYRRMGNFSYVVSDEDIPRASEILSNIGLPLFPHSKLLSIVEGDIHTKATFHRMTRSSEPAWVQCFVLLPASFVSFNPEEHYTTPSYHLYPSTSPIQILVPKPSAVYGWFMRTMLKYSAGCCIRTVLNGELSELVCYHLLDVKEGYVDLDGHPELWEEMDMDGRIAKALDVICQWTEKGEWREGEEWMKDALKAIVTGDGDIGHLPGKPKTE